jgi:hypothetical protein
MGRSLKIQKTNIGSGSTVTGNPPVTTYNQNVLTDAGFTSFGNLIDPDAGSGTGLTNSQFLGVVGGVPATSNPSATFPEVLTQANILLANGTNTAYGNSQIIRQKGAHKFMVANIDAVTNDGSFIVGQAYQIASLGDTNWYTAGAPYTVAVGDVFTATTVGGAGTGTAYPVGTCVLQNSATPTAGFMSVGYTFNGGSTTYASYITNKWVRDWNGMTYGNYNNSNDGENIYSNENYYVANFFSNVGTVTLSGADVINSQLANNGSVYIAQIDNVTA